MIVAANPQPNVRAFFPRLREEGWQVEVSRNLPEAAVSLSRRRHEALLVDQSDMPDDGHFIGTLRDTFPEVKIILTGNPAPHDDRVDACVAVPDELPALPKILTSRVGKHSPSPTPGPRELLPRLNDASGPAESITEATYRWKQAALWPEELYSAITDSFHTMAGTPWVSLLLPKGESEKGLRMVSSRGLPLNGPVQNELEHALDIARLASRQGDAPFHVPDFEDTPTPRHSEFGEQRVLSVPLKTEGEVIGVVNLGVPRHLERYNEAQIELFSALAREAAALIKLSNRVQDIRHEALVDALTGAYNRRYFDIALRREVERAERSGRGLVLAILDIDHFKEYNDEYGHPAGDRALQRITRAIQDNIRCSDTLCRYGGEEFAIILPDTGTTQPIDRENGLHIVDRVRRAVANLQFQPQSAENVQQLTISGGLSVLGEDASDAEGLIRCADRKLYRAKGNGRNCIFAETG